ncbi:MAG: hypothetical protein ACYC64_02930 [Armatimonadota bacterium]
MSKTMRFLGTAALLLCVLLSAAHAGVMLDESNATLTGNAYATLDVNATPAGPASNAIYLSGDGVATWQTALVVGRKYAVTVRRVILVNTSEYDTQFKIEINGQLCMTDWAKTTNVLLNDKYVVQEFLGYYYASTAPATVRIYDGGPSFARVDYVRLDPLTDAYLDENSQAILLGDASTYTIVPSSPVNYGTVPTSAPNAYFIGASGSVSGNVTLVPGTVYNVYASRVVNTLGNTSYDLEINGSLFAHDPALPAAPILSGDPAEEVFLGQYTAASASVPVKLYNPGIWGARVDYVRFEKAVGASIVLDESNVTLAGDGGLGYNPLATPNVDPNFIGFQNGSGTWTVNLTPGRKYKLTTRRTVTTSNNTRFAIDFNGSYYIPDLAFTPDAAQDNQCLEYTFLGYLMPSSAASTVVIHDGGPWFARVDYLKIDPTDDIYFDENSELTFEFGAALFQFGTNGSWPANPGTMPVSAPNGFAFGQDQGPGAVSGTVTLQPGATYSVYASRQVHSTGNMAYQVDLGGVMFAYDSAKTVDPWHEDFLEEAYLGDYVANSAVTTVKCHWGGIWAARVDYLRFVLVSSPESTQSVGAVKNLGDGTRIAITQPVVATANAGTYTSTFGDGSYYIEDIDRTAGIKVVPDSGAVTDIAKGFTLTLVGDVHSDENGKKYIKAISVTVGPQVDPLTPLGLPNKSLSSTTGLDSTGLYVKIWGVVKAKTAYYLDISDGSGAPVRVQLSGLTNPLSIDPNVDQYISVSGIADVGTGGIPVIKPMTNSDITIIF